MPALGNANGRRGQVRFLQLATGLSSSSDIVPGSGERCERRDGLRKDGLVMSIK